jgi:putative two-component system response regulator
MKILIADDDPIALAVLSNAITSFGYEPILATDGAEALQKLRSESPQMIVSDVQMPEMTGEELCREVRRRDAAQYTYVILLTSDAKTKNIVAGLDAGADDYVAKPIKAEELRLRIEAGRRLLALEGRDLMIFALAKLAESRDKDTGKHLERIREYSRVLANELASTSDFCDVIDQPFIDLLYMTSPLHDVGKVGIPDSILLKPGRLTVEEFDIMKQHTIIGCETLKASADSHPEASFLQMALDITLRHHEKWDGSGYPAGLSGEDIPLAARIVAVADVYDALTTQRCYKDAYSHEKACSIICSSSGSHFDPRIIEAFERIRPQMSEIRMNLDDSSRTIAPVGHSSNTSANTHANVTLPAAAAQNSLA